MIRQRQLLTLAMAGLATLAYAMAFAGEAPDPLADVLKRVTSEDAAVRKAAFGELARLGPRGVGQLCQRLVEPGKGNDVGERFALHGMAVWVARPGAEAERAAFVQAVAGQLATALPVEVKRFLIRQLQHAGREDVVPVLARWLADKALGEQARQALVANPTEAALEALRRALPRARGADRVGLIDALGYRRDKAAVAALIAEAKSADGAIRAAACQALGRIGEARAAPAIAAALGKGTGDQRRAAFDGYLLLADNLAAAGEKAEAARLYADALRRAPRGQLRCAALIGLAKAGAGDVLAVVVPHLADPDPTVRRAAKACLAKTPDAQVAAAIAQHMDKGEPKVRAGLLRVLADRKDPKARRTIEAALKDPSAEVRVAAADLLGKLDEPALEPTLVEAAEKGSEFIHPVAVSAYIRQADARRQKGQKAKALAMLQRALKLARDDAALQRQAVRGLAALASVEALPQVKALLDNEAVRGEALGAYVAIAATVAAAGDKARAIEMMKEAVRLAPPANVAEDARKRLWDLGIKIDPARMSGYVTTWWILGPFPGDTIDKAEAPEKGVHLKAEVKVGDRTLRWTRHHTAHAQGVVDLGALLRPNQNVSAYLYAEISVPKAQDVVFRSGSDDALKVWLNGKLVFRFGSPRSLTIDQDTFHGHLDAGTNRLLVKISQGGGGWQGCLRLLGPDGRAVEFEQREE